MCTCFFGGIFNFFSCGICFTVCNGIIGVGSVTAFGKIGKKYLLCFVGLSFVICIVSAILVYPLVLHGASGENHTVNLQMRQISAIIFDMLPTNPIESFQTGNSIQIIIIALIVGAGLLAAGERALDDEAGQRDQRDGVRKHHELVEHVLELPHDIVLKHRADEREHGGNQREHERDASHA